LRLQKLVRCHRRPPAAADGSPLPLELYGILLEGLSPVPLKFFAWPFTRRKIAAADFSYVDMEFQRRLQIEDHCSGLLCLRDYDQEIQDDDDKLVVNPATRQWARLPPPPCTAMEFFVDQMCLVFDPTVSPHYEVLLVHRVPWWAGSMPLFTSTKEAEWPPSPYAVPVFSSKTWTWEERMFVRRGEPAGTNADMHSDLIRDHFHRYVAYWKGAVYVHCQNDSMMRYISIHPLNMRGHF
jgi:hypothetical protein